MWDDSRFWDRTAQAYARRPVSDEAALARKLGSIREHLAKDARVIEIGCGTGTTALTLAPHVGHVLAADFSLAMLGIAREKAAAQGATNVTFVHCALEDLDLPDGEADAVLLLNLLHLLEDRKVAIARAVRMLKPGGVLATSTACLGDGMRWVGVLIPALRLVGKAPRVATFTGDALRDDLRTAGMQIIDDWRPKPRSALFLLARKPG
jgi:ubiquinone/menaquinone biosynthesis C-methylase UbiE